MNPPNQGFKVRLGTFIIVGIALFVLVIFIIGKQKHLFDPVFGITAKFENVSGLQVGSAVRFSGINIGTVDRIRIVNDSTVRVDMLIKEDVRRFIREDSEAGIGSEGIIGDKLVVLSQGSPKAKIVKDGQVIGSSEPVETDAIMASLQVTVDNAALATGQITDILGKVNSGEGTLGRLIQDKSMAENIDATIVNLKKSTKGLDENMNAAKENFLLKGYFKRKQKEEEKKKRAAEKAAKKAARQAERDAKQAEKDAEKAAEKAADEAK